MEIVRESWTDERLDDFREETARRFDTLERRMDEGFDRVDAKFDHVQKRFDALQYMILRLGGGALITFVVGFAGVIVTQ